MNRDVLSFVNNGLTFHLSTNLFKKERFSVFPQNVRWGFDTLTINDGATRVC